MIFTAALVLVGSELISGDVRDENRQFISDKLRSAGVHVAGVHIVRDEVEIIADLVRFLSTRVTYVITVGGLGPSLDDVTLEAVTRAFRLPLVTREPEDRADYARMSGSETVQPQLRHFPKGAEVVPTDHGPVVRTENVYSLPGLPRLVKARFPTLLRRLGSGAIHSRTLSLVMPQSRVAPVLERASELHPSVSIGCYPSSELHDGVALLFEGTDREEINRCISMVQSSLTSG
jgi:molybdenum cofactor synthesis domain-containing protein